MSQCSWRIVAAVLAIVLATQFAWLAELLSSVFSRAKREAC